MFINLTPHDIHIYKEESFINLSNDTGNLWLADEVEGEPLLFIPSSGTIRIKRLETPLEIYVNGVAVPLISSKGSLEISTDVLEYHDHLIVSAITKSAAKELNHPYADRMYTPYKVVRLRDFEGQPTTTILGCVGLIN